MRVPREKEQGEEETDFLDKKEYYCLLTYPLNKKETGNIELSVDTLRSTGHRLSHNLHHHTPPHSPLHTKEGLPQ